MGAAIFQMVTAGVVGGVAIAYIAYAIGVDRVIVRAIRYAFGAVEIVIAIPMSWLPTPRYRYRGRHA